VVVVGAGLAGLTCALQLTDRGLRPDVYEASHRVGGRMFSNGDYWRDAQVSEWCGELIDTGHRAVRHFAKRFGLALDDLLAAQQTGSEDTYYFFGQHYPKAQADRDFAGIYRAVMADLRAAGYPTRYDAYTAAGAALDRMSLYDWIESRVPGGHSVPLGQLLDVAYAIEFGAQTTDQSALNLLYLLGYQPSRGELAVFGESDERFHIRGGNEQLPRAIAAHIGEPLLHKGRRLLRLARTPGNRYRLTFQRSEGGTCDVAADLVVLAVPFAVLRDVDCSAAGFDPLKQRAIDELGRGRSGKLQLQFDSRIWRHRGAWPGVSNGSSYSDTGYQSGWEVTRAQAGRPGIMNLFSGGEVTEAMATQRPFATASDGNVVTDAQRVLSQLEPVFPGLTAAWNGKATQSLPHKSSLFRASYAYYRVGQYTAFGGYEGAVQGGVYFCGDHTSMDFQGYMEGAAVEGRRVGRELLRRLRG
jgi:monoamine oxidase